MTHEDINTIEKQLIGIEPVYWVNYQLALAHARIKCNVGLNAYYLLKLHLKKHELNNKT